MSYTAPGRCARLHTNYSNDMPWP